VSRTTLDYGEYLPKPIDFDRLIVKILQIEHDSDTFSGG